MDQPPFRPRLRDLLVDVRRRLGGAEDLESELASVARSRHPDPGHRHVDLPRAPERQGRAAEIALAERLEKRARVRPHESDHGLRRGRVEDADALSAVAPDPIQILAPRCRAAHDPPCAFIEAGDRHVRLDPPPLVQHLGIGGPARRQIDIAHAQPLHRVQGAPPLHVDLGEGTQIEERNPGRRGLPLAGRVRPPGLGPVAVLGLRLARVAREPQGPFPARELAEHRPVPRQSVVQHGAADAASARRLLARPVHVELVGHRLAHAIAQAGRRGGMPVEARRVDLPQVERGPPIQDALRHRLPDAGGGDDAEGVEAGRDVVPVEPRHAAEQRPGVRCERLGAIHEVLNADPLEVRDPMECGVQEGLELVPVLGQLDERRRERGVSGIQRLRVRLETAEHQPARVPLEVDPGIQVANDGAGRRQTGHRAGDHVHVRDGLDRRRLVQHRADRRRPDPRAVDQRVAPNPPAVIEDDSGNPATAGLDGMDGRVLLDPDAVRTRALGVRHADIDRVGLAVFLHPETAAKVVHLEQRTSLLQLGSGRHRHAKSHPLADARDAGKLAHALLGLGQPDPAGAHVPGGLAGLGLELREELRRADREPGRGKGGAQRADDPGRVPGGATGQLVAFEHEHFVRPAPAEVVRNAEPDHPAADDHDSRPRHGALPAAFG